MKVSFASVPLVVALLLSTPAIAQFLETPSPPPPSAKDLDLPAIVDTVSGFDVVDEGGGDGANGFIKDRAAAILLGKAFFWDMQVGSDGVACATCHYHAGADARERNQLSPGLNGGNEAFDPTPGGGGGPNYVLTAADFPLDTDDAVSSQGTFSATFNDVLPGAPGATDKKSLGRSDDDCTIVSPDEDGFHLNNINVRRVEPRNTPTVINAAFNHRNFWDGRANNIFNGVDAFGQRNATAMVLEKQGNGDVDPLQVAFENASLASQSMAPPASAFEMSCGGDPGRSFLKIGKKMVTAEALAGQRVHPNDSVLGAVSNHPKEGLNGQGNNGIPYSDLIEAAISDRFWDSDKLFDANKEEVGIGPPANTDEYTLMEANFSLIWGLAIQEYLRTLVSDDAPYDQWAEDPGNEDRSTAVSNGRGILSEAQMRGMELFFTNALGVYPAPELGLRANCSTCHQGPLFSTATFPFTIEEESGEFPEQEQLVERMRRGDGVSIIENLFRYFVTGTGSVGGFALDGTAGSRELPNHYPATVGGDLTVNGSSTCDVYSYLTNEDTIFIPNPGGPFPPFIEVPNTATRDARIVLRNCQPDLWLQITLIDGGPGADSAIIEEIEPIVLPPPQEPTLPIDVIQVLAAGAIDGDFSLEIPTLYDTAFYNIGVRPTAEDPGIGADDPFGNPLSFTQQWIQGLLGTPVSDDISFKGLQLARIAEPFSWYGDGVFFPGGFDGPEWPVIGFFPCDPPIFGAPPAGIFGACTLGIENGKGDEAYPKYPTGLGPGVDFLQEQAINSMPTATGGAFKVPNLRNVTLTAPYFHNGGQLTLDQVVQFYNRGGDFAMLNLGDLAPNIHPLNLDAGQMGDIVAFMDSLTDARVTCEMAPFDHPEIRIANGARGEGGAVTEDNQNPGQSKDQIELIQAVGAGGRPGNFAPCIDQENFLQ